ncbi:CoA-transferase [Rhodopila sp.]|uniref:CoA-transferase n=1 Tax=Rhodopila sp. TaxID=2480087 RepID=UPI003D0C95E2
MLSSPARAERMIRPPRHWKTASAEAVAAQIPRGATIAVGWLGDVLGNALEAAFLAQGAPRDLTIVYATTHGDGRTHGLNHLAHVGMVRRVIGGQWHPVPGLQALARTERIEAYSLPAGFIRHLFRDIAAGLPGHLSRGGLGTFADPRQGGGRLNQATREELVHVVRAAGQDALLMHSFPIDVALISVAFMEGSAAIAMTRDAMTIARAVQASGGLVIAQMDRVGTMEKLPPGQVVVPDTLVDVLVAADPRERTETTFSSPLAMPKGQRRLTH